MSAYLQAYVYLLARSPYDHLPDAGVRLGDARGSPRYVRPTALGEFGDNSAENSPSAERSAWTDGTGVMGPTSVIAGGIIRIEFRRAFNDLHDGSKQNKHCRQIAV